MSWDEQPALFEMPSTRARKAPPKRTGRAVYAKYKPAVRRLCDDCVRDIHARGVAVAPLPASVRWRRTLDGATDYLCARHKDERVATDA